MEASKITDLDGVVIRSTKDYNKFKTIVGQRDVRHKHVTALMDSFSKQQVASVAIVNEDGYIIDGGHRYVVCKELNLPYNYIVMKGYTVAEIHILNSNGANWKEIDFIKQHADLYDIDNARYHEYRGYKRVVELIDAEVLHYKTALYMLEGGKVSGSKVITNGDLVVDDNNHKKVAERVDLLNKCVGILGSKAKTSSFAQAVVLVLEIPEFDKRTFLMKIKTNSAMILNSKSGKEYLLEVFQNAYNKGLAINKQLGIKLLAEQVYKQLSTKDA